MRTRRPASPALAPVPISAGPSAVSTVAATAQAPSEPCAGELSNGGAAQPAAGREQRDGLEQIGLARAVGPDQHQVPPIEIERRRGVVAEVREAQAGDGGSWRAVSESPSAE